MASALIWGAVLLNGVVAAQQYVKTEKNQYCPSGTELTTEDECKKAAAALSLNFAQMYNLAGDHRYCLFADDGRSTTYFNAAGTAGAATPPNPAYASLCSAPAAGAGAAAAPAQGQGLPAPKLPSEWPACQEQNTVIRNAGQALFANLQGYGATIGCFLDDCMATDKFVAAEIESCTKVCHSMPECAFWVWGTEEGEQKCWFRTGDAGREAGEGWISGSKTCVPPGTQALTMGNDECWAEGFGYPECCDAKYGPNGNAQCWDGVYNYDRCCFPKEEL